MDGHLTSWIASSTPVDPGPGMRLPAEYFNLRDAIQKISEKCIKFNSQGAAHAYRFDGKTTFTVWATKQFPGFSFTHENRHEILSLSNSLALVKKKNHPCKRVSGESHHYQIYENAVAMAYGLYASELTAEERESALVEIGNR